jgi:hypothetical protein
MLLLTAWQYPKEISKLLAKNGKPGQRFFTKDDFFLIEPLLSALDSAGRLTRLDAVGNYSVNLKLSADIKRAEFLNKRLSQSVIAAEKRKLRAKIRSMANKWIACAEFVGVDIPRCLFIPDAHPVTSRAREPPVRPPVPLASRSHMLQSGDPNVHPPLEPSAETSNDDPEVIETRRVRFVSPSPDNMERDDSSSTTDHELLVDTPDWEEL